MTSPPCVCGWFDCLLQYDPKIAAPAASTNTSPNNPPNNPDASPATAANPDAAADANATAAINPAAATANPDAPNDANVLNAVFAASIIHCAAFFTWDTAHFIWSFTHVIVIIAHLNRVATRVTPKNSFNATMKCWIVFINNCNFVFAAKTIAAPAIAPTISAPVSERAPTIDRNIAAAIPAMPPVTPVTATATSPVLSSSSHCKYKMPTPAAAPAAAPTTPSPTTDINT